MTASYLVQEPDQGVQMFGPFGDREKYILTIDGCLIPYVEIYKYTRTDEDDIKAEGDYEIHVDNRIIYFAFEGFIKRWARFLINAMAWSAGYEGFGEQAQPRQHFCYPYKSKLIECGNMSSDDIPDGTRLTKTQFTLPEVWSQVIVNGCLIPGLQYRELDGFMSVLHLTETEHKLIAPRAEVERYGELVALLMALSAGFNYPSYDAGRRNDFNQRVAFIVEEVEEG